MAEQHTIEQLEAMSDGELAELAARRRGWTLKHGKMQINEVYSVSGRMYHENGKVVHRHSTWNPAADVSQAYGLLTWAYQQGHAEFEVCVRDIAQVFVFMSQGSDFFIPGNDARAMAFAFVMAMQEAIND